MCKSETDHKVTYKVIHEYNLKKFNETLNKMYEDGWELDGNIVVAADTHYVHYCQRMILVEKVSKSTTKAGMED